jgi:hypothetical protein
MRVRKYNHLVYADVFDNFEGDLLAYLCVCGGDGLTEA